MARDALAEAEQVLTIGLAQADAGVSLRSRDGKAAARELLEMLEQADRELRKRLEAEARRAGPDQRFTGAGLLAYQRQVELVTGYVRRRLDGMSRRQARSAMRRGWFGTVGMLGRLEEAFTGSVRPLRVNTARMFNERTRGVRASLLRQHATSMDRYGAKLERAMREALRTNLLAGGTFSQAVDQLVQLRGPRGRVSMAARELGDGTVERIRLETIPEGLFRRYRYWAMRIVRTETAYAQNAAALEALVAARDEDFPDMQKKILAMMDARTYPDSIAVHGQIRELDGLFRDGAGREYLHPPARPNDREVVIPWRPEWTETETSAPRPSLEEAIERARGNRETTPQPEVTSAIAAETPEQHAEDLETARAAEREKLLQGLGWDPLAVQRDAFEMGAPEATAEALRAIAQEGRDAIAPLAEGGRLTPARQKRLRMTVRRMIRTISPRFGTQDVVEANARAGAFRVLREGMKRARGMMGWHSNRGSLGLREDQLRQVARAVQRMADGEPLDAHDLEGLHTMIHEEHHGASPAAHGMGAYRGQGGILEEAVTESRARAVTNRLGEIVPTQPHMPRALPYVRSRRGELTAGEAPPQSYQAFVEQLHLAVAEASGMGRETLVDHVQERLASGWFVPAAPGQGPRTADEYIDRIANLLHPEDPERLARSLRRRLQNVPRPSLPLSRQPEGRRR